MASRWQVRLVSLADLPAIQELPDRSSIGDAGEWELVAVDKDDFAHFKRKLPFDLEYKQVILPDVDSAEIIGKAMTEAAQGGWRLVQFFPVTPDALPMAIFERVRDGGSANSEG